MHATETYVFLNESQKNEPYKRRNGVLGQVIHDVTRSEVSPAVGDVFAQFQNTYVILKCSFRLLLLLLSGWLVWLRLVLRLP